MDIDLVVEFVQLEHSVAPFVRQALAIAAAMADGWVQNSLMASFAAQHQLMHQPIVPIVVVLLAVNIPMPDQMVAVYIDCKIKLKFQLVFKYKS